MAGSCEDASHTRTAICRSAPHPCQRPRCPTTCSSYRGSSGGTTWSSDIKNPNGCINCSQCHNVPPKSDPISSTRNGRRVLTVLSNCRNSQSPCTNSTGQAGLEYC